VSWARNAGSAVGKASQASEPCVAQSGPELLGHVRRQRGEHEHQRLDDLAGRAAVGEPGGQVVVELGDPGDGGVEPERLHAVAHRVDGAVQDPAGLVVGRGVAHPQGAGVLVDDVAPDPLQQAEDADHVTGVPGPALVERPGEHLVEPEGVGPVLGVHLVGRHRVLEALAHLAELPPDLLPAVEEAAVPLLHLGGLHVEAPLVGVRRGLDVALVEQAPERLRRADVAQVEEHLVPEAGVEQVEHGVLDAADVEVDAAAVALVAGAHPVPLDLGVDEGVLVGGVEVAQLVPARPRPLRHRVQLPPVHLRARHRGRA
jgi:hypothetical protein